MVNIMKQTIRINEAQLRKVVAESVKKVLNEGNAQRYLDDNGKPVYYATEDDEDIDYRMERCAQAAQEFINKKQIECGTEWFNEFREKCSHDGMFNVLDEKQVKECFIQGNMAAHSNIYNGNGVRTGKIRAHYDGNWHGDNI